MRVIEERDVVIIGGGPAGATAAIALAAADAGVAARTVVLERAKYPREKPCAGALGERGVAILRALDALPDVPHVPVDGISLRGGAGECAARVGGIGRVVRRIEFDHALARIASSRGVEVRDDTRVDDVLDDVVDDAGAGDGEAARVLTSRGEIRARVVIGADGVGSVVRKSMGLSAGRMRAQVLEVDTPPVAGDRDRALLHFDAADRRLPGYTWDFPTVVGGEAMVCRGIYHLKADGDDVDIRALLAERLAAMGLDLARFKNKRYAERGFEPSDVVARGARMLVGEAAGIDPVTGEGIAQAIEMGELAGRFAARAARGEVRVDAWRAAIDGSRIARDLGIRARFVPLFYGGARAEVEDFLLESPDALFVGCQHFGGKSYDWPRLAQVLGSGVAHLAANAVRRALAR